MPNFFIPFYIKCMCISRLLQIMNKMRVDINCNEWFRFKYFVIF